MKRKGRLKEKICSDCGESFRNEILLNRHLRDKHDFQGKDFYFLKDNCFEGELVKNRIQPLLKLPYKAQQKHIGHF